MREWVDERVLAKISLLYFADDIDTVDCYNYSCVLRNARDEEELRVDFYSLIRGSSASGCGDYEWNYCIGIVKLSF